MLLQAQVKQLTANKEKKKKKVTLKLVTNETLEQEFQARLAIIVTHNWTICFTLFRLSWCMFSQALVALTQCRISAATSHLTSKGWRLFRITSFVAWHKSGLHFFSISNECVAQVDKPLLLQAVLYVAHVTLQHNAAGRCCSCQCRQFLKQAFSGTCLKNNVIKIKKKY